MRNCCVACGHELPEEWSSWLCRACEVESQTEDETMTEEQLAQQITELLQEEQ